MPFFDFFTKKNTKVVPIKAAANKAPSDNPSVRKNSGSFHGTTHTSSNSSSKSQVAWGESTLSSPAPRGSASSNSNVSNSGQVKSSLVTPLKVILEEPIVVSKAETLTDKNDIKKKAKEPTINTEEESLYDKIFRNTVDSEVENATPDFDGLCHHSSRDRLIKSICLYLNQICIKNGGANAVINPILPAVFYNRDDKSPIDLVLPNVIDLIEEDSTKEISVKNLLDMLIIIRRFCKTENLNFSNLNCVTLAALEFACRNERKNTLTEENSDITSADLANMQEIIGKRLGKNKAFLTKNYREILRQLDQSDKDHHPQYVKVGLYHVANLQAKGGLPLPQQFLDLNVPETTRPRR